ncbi:MAG: NAD(+)/NADH kinase [Chloroflexi bacterium]|nr:NAD(+)/NADH kinase [Chloroflexota bacterium]MCY3937121.1 NAD(+)/NADH kinase [Chloroflexota bacterium]
MKVGLVYQPKTQAAVATASAAHDRLMELGHLSWMLPSWEMGETTPRLRDTDLLLSLGGDGTLLRAVRAAAPFGTPCIGVNFGKLGFLTELEALDIESLIAKVEAGEGWLEERVMLDWRLIRRDREVASGFATNDIVVARGAISRVIDISLKIDGGSIVTYTADGVVVTNPTGSTGYGLALGGPIMHPQARTLAIVPICPFLTANNSLVAGADAQIDLTVDSQHEVGLTVDGQTHIPMRDGDRVSCTASEHSARFLRFGPRNYFFPVLARKMRWSVPREILNPDPPPE